MEVFAKPEDFGPYKLIGKIAKGGMSEVFLGTSRQAEQQGRFMAIKRLLPTISNNKPFVNLLIHEAKVGVLLNHPSIVQVFDLGYHNGEFFLATEYVHGKSLAEILKRAKEKNAPLGFEMSTFIVAEILKALTFAHNLKDRKDRDLGIIHRDVTPGNILISYLGEIKLADFGIATAENRLQPGFTQSAMGKIAYASPEQAVNDPATQATDIYSLGVVYFELLAGRLPFESSNSNELFKKVIEGPTPDIKNYVPNIPEKIRDLIMKCIDRNAKNRPQTCPILFNELQTFFKADQNIDFTLRVSKTYFQKKFADYLQYLFAEEISQELKIIEGSTSLTSSFEDEVTARAVRSIAFTNSSSEDQSTHHFSFDEAEPAPQAGLRELTAYEPAAVNPEEFEKFCKEQTQAEKENPALRKSTSHFTTGPSFKPVPVAEKLKNSSLSRHEKEALKEIKPQLEITSDIDLENFESKTLAGVIDPTIILGDEEFLPIKNKAFGNINTKPVSIINDEKLRASAYGRKPNKNFKFGIISSIVEEVLSFPLHRWISLLVFLAVIALGIQNYSGIKETLISQSETRFNTPQNIYLQFLGEVSSDPQEKMLKSFQEPQTTPNLRQLEDFFNREYRRYSKKNQNILKLEINNYPVTLLNILSKQPNISHLLSTSQVFSFLEQSGLKAETKSNSFIYVYFYNYDPRSRSNFAFPQNFRGKRPPQKGIVFAPAHESQRLKIISSIAREIGMIYGASDKQNPITQMPIIPDGLGDMAQTPMYPQFKTEIMAGEIAVGPFQKESINNIHQLTIGPKTAYEFGWISKETFQRLVKTKPH